MATASKRATSRKDHARASGHEWREIVQELCESRGGLDMPGPKFEAAKKSGWVPVDERRLEMPGPKCEAAKKSGWVPVDEMRKRGMV